VRYKKLQKNVMVCFVLSCALVMGGLKTNLIAQESETQPLTQDKTGKLRILVLEGDGAINNVRQRTAREPIVRVVDENNRPIASAMVMFILPDSGPGGVFADGSKSLLTYSNKKGEAIAKGLKPNGTAGQFQISVNASYQGITSSALVSQTNTLATAAAVGAAAGISKTLIAILAIAGGAAAAGAVVATGGGGGSTAAPPVTQPSPPSITINGPGTPTFGPQN
jgi:hypothetical protein